MYTVEVKIQKMFEYIDSIPDEYKIQTLTGVKYDSPMMDFERLILNTSNNIFIFNDNYLEHESSKPGAGNAKIRKYNNYSRLEVPRSFGIPTGHYRSGYTSLEESIDNINECIIELITLILQYRIRNLVYSISSINSPIIGTGIFQVNRDVLSYITECIFRLSRNGSYSTMSNFTGFKSEYQIDQERIDCIKSI